MDALTALRTRRSIRHYASRPLPREVLEQIVDAGRLAATARNLQPWHFVVVTERATLDKLAELCEYGKFLRQAPACIVVFCNADAKYYLEDGSAATQNMLVAAHALGLGACWIAGDKKPYASEVANLLHAPPSVRLISLIAVGYPAGPPPSVPKKPQSEVLHWEHFSTSTK
ncbi:MAG: nitroreductase family protein [bacterium]|nr:nitroreductase family protein [bacterium]